MTEIQKVTKTVEVEGIELPYHWESAYPGSTFKPQSGKVFIEADTLIEVSEQDQWAGAFGESLVIAPRWADLALEQAGLAVRETRGGVHGTPALKELLKKFGWI